MITAIYMYRLKKGKSIDKYIKWSIEQDQKIVNSLDGIKSFEVHLVEGPEKKWDVFEVVKVDSWERWREINNSSVMEKLKSQFKHLVDTHSVVRFYGEKIE